MKKDIWCTLGPSSLNQRVIKRLQDIGVTVFRINLSHISITNLRKTIKKLGILLMCLSIWILKDFKFVQVQ